MLKLIKEIFSLDNLKKAMLYSALTKPNINSSEFAHLSNVLRDMDAKNIDDNITKEVNTKKVA